MIGLETLDVPAYKIGSGEADNLPLIRHIASKGKPVIMSTGMQTIETLRASVGHLIMLVLIMRSSNAQIFIHRLQK